MNPTRNDTIATMLQHKAGFNERTGIKIGVFPLPEQPDWRKLTFTKGDNQYVVHIPLDVLEGQDDVNGCVEEFLNYADLLLNIPR